MEEGAFYVGLDGEMGSVGWGVQRVVRISLGCFSSCVWLDAGGTGGGGRGVWLQLDVYGGFLWQYKRLWYVGRYRGCRHSCSYSWRQSV